jgi:hypothetical protein
MVKSLVYKLKANTVTLFYNRWRLWNMHECYFFYIEIFITQTLHSKQTRRSYRNAGCEHWTVSLKHFYSYIIESLELWRSSEQYHQKHLWNCREVYYEIVTLLFFKFIQVVSKHQHCQDTCLLNTWIQSGCFINHPLHYLKGILNFAHTMYLSVSYYSQKKKNKDSSLNIITNWWF